jgi:glyoxylase-like metal-dependent hydrolase (beta-lactamase superfamily II)
LSRRSPHEGKGASEWFVTREVARGIWLVAEPSHVNTWLVEGSERAALIDTGLGITPIRPVAESLTSHPISVVNTHCHFDHVGGNYEFEEIAIHELGASLLAQPVPRAVLAAYLTYTERLLEGADLYRSLDGEFFHLLSLEGDPRPLPREFDSDAWTIRPSVASTILREGDRIDLGDRSLAVLHTPGHTPDCICLLDDRDGVLFGGDTINTGPIYAQLADSDLEAFAASANRLASIADQVSMVAVHHFGRVIADRFLLGEVADGFTRLLEGGVDFRPARDCLDTPVLEAKFERFSVLLPANADA